LLVHHAEMPVLLQSKALAPIARHMVGFGMPPSAARTRAGEVMPDDGVPFTAIVTISDGRQPRPSRAAP